MTAQPVHDPKTPIDEILQAAGSEGLLLESEDRGRYVLIPLDDDVIDFLIERDPKFLARCREIRGRSGAGQFRTHAEVRSQQPGE